MNKKLKTHLKTIKHVNRAPKMTVATWLPVFTGYYHSIFDCSDSVIDSECNLTDSEYAEYYPELVKAGVTHEFFSNNLWEFTDFSKCFNEASESICNTLPQLNSAGIILNTKYEKLVSPKYYNFSTDSINCKITFNPKKLQRYIQDNIEAFTEYVKNRYTSRDGFSSHYSNDVTDWEDVEDYGDHSTGAVLQFVIFNEYGNKYDAEHDLYDFSNCHEDFYSYMEFDSSGMIEAFNNQKKAV